MTLPEGERGIAARHPGDRAIARDPATLFHDDFSSGAPSGWDEVYHAQNLKVVRDGGRPALEMTVPQQSAEVSNALVKKLAGHDTVFLRYYSRFEPGFDQTGSSHNGGYLAAVSPGRPYATPGVRADGSNKFGASFENWREDAATPSPGHLNIYAYHPEQRSQWGDHLFPSGKVLPFSAQPGKFGPDFTPRPDLIPEIGRWYCFELMVAANAPGQRDGRIACWLDGKLIADFTGLRLRDTAALKINHVEIDLHIGSNRVRENRKRYADIVVATSYIGPKAGTKRRG